MEKLRGDNGKAMDMCVKELREANSNATEMEQAIESPPTNTFVTRANTQRNNVNIYARRRQLFEKSNRKVWISLGSDFEVPTLQI